MASETRITERYFQYGGRKYFRGQAENVEIASFGEKKAPLIGIPYLAVESRVVRANLVGRVRRLDVVDIDWSNEKKAEVEAHGEFTYYGVTGKGGQKASYEKAKSAQLKLVKFVIDEGPLKTMLNGDAHAALAFLRKEGGDGRITSQIWTVMEGELAAKFKASASMQTSVSRGSDELELSVGASGNGSERIVLARGATFAYSLHRVSNWNPGKTRADDLDDDFVN